ncbi:phage/plasmid primase, P4 family [Streptomyces sp. NPDC001404]|uniref:phage/plasmid primase, P4 family n=1 Tax=Streptomyces sp. NPDC001404 TaxID=3364571 RepID=UPI0036AB9B23
MLFTDVLSRFGDVAEHADGGYVARCPAHDDTDPSLRIWRGEDHTVRVHCRAGCASDDVVRAVSLTWRDLFRVTGDGATVPAGRPQLVSVGPVAGLAGYVDRTTARLLDADQARAGEARDYLARRFGLDLDTAAELRLGVDAGGEDEPFVYLSRGYRAFPRLTVPLVGFDGVARGLQGRDLSGQCPGRWLSLINPKGERWAPYGHFVGQGGYSTTIITEGPGDALTVVALGYSAVAIRGASLAGNPELVAELAEGLRDQLVIIAGDNDRAGRGFTAKLAEGFAAHGITAHRLEIPYAGDDLTDWRARNPATFPVELHRAVRVARPVQDAAAVEAEARSTELSARTGADTVSVDQGSEAASILAGLMATYGESDALNAHALVAWSGGTIRHAPGLGFFVWTGKVWEPSTTKVRQAVHRMGAALVLAGQTKEARGFLMTTRIDALLTELRSVPSVHVEATEFDNRPDLLAFRNGVVDLRTGELRPHDMRDMLTYVLDIDYDPAAKCPRWERFLEEIFPNMVEMPAYMRRLIGYGITGHTSEQSFAILWGQGANGKSVFVDVLTSVFRAITKTTGFATFEAKSGSGIPNDIAALRGSRLVMASEGESGVPMSEAILKRVTGKDMVQARFLHKEFFEFRPSFLLLLASNHKPKFKSQDNGLWRRIKMVPFLRTFAPEERDHELDKRLLTEAAGIAAWAVRGAGEWYRDGLGDPTVILRASREYRETSDQLAGFFPGVLERDPSAVMLGNEAFNTYLEWAEDENLPQRERWTRRTFYFAMEERGVTRKKTAKGISLVGLRPAESSPDAVGPGIFSN